jgi:hypothetical protein
MVREGQRSPDYWAIAWATRSFDALTNDKDEKSERGDSFVEVVDGW